MPERARRIAKRVALSAVIVTGLLVVLAAVAYEYGSMEPPSPEMRARYAELQAAGQAPAVAERFHVPVPGCRCHSDDPVLQMQHASIPIRECSSCHGGNGGAQVTSR